MEVFNYENIGIFAKYAKEIYIGSLIIAAIVALFVIIVNFRDSYKSIFSKLLTTVITLAVCVGVYFLSGWIYNSNVDTCAKIDDYRAAYAAGEVKQINGTVEEFASYSDRKTFKLAGESFVIYSSVDYKLPAEDRQVVVHYVYSSGGTSMNYNSLSNHYDYSYKPENCVIGDNKKLELHYIEEFGEKRILYIKELP